jgi:hypothetical protein
MAERKPRESKNSTHMERCEVGEVRWMDDVGSLPRVLRLVEEKKRCFDAALARTCHQVKQRAVHHSLPSSSSCAG